jgi:HD-GYP domain-containing protein (c-di-GMP phosphodiesterase class II)
MRTRYVIGVPGAAPTGAEAVRRAEVVAALSLATDLGTGLPLEHGLQSTLVAMRLAQRLGVAPDTALDTYYGSLLFYVGCTVDAQTSAVLFPDGALLKHFNPVIFGTPTQTMRGIVRALAAADSSLPAQARRVATTLPRAIRGHQRHIVAMCEVAQMLTDQLALPPSVRALFGHFTDRWDGKGSHRRGADQLPLALRIVHVARDAALQQLIGGPEYAARVVGERAGHAFDPAVVAPLVAEYPEILAWNDAGSVWEETLAAEPGPAAALDSGALDDALAAMGNFADLISPYLVGHSAGVAGLTRSAAHLCGYSEAQIATVRRCGLVHDIGRVAISAGIWHKPGPLSVSEWEQVRLHAYQGERILGRSPYLAGLVSIACRHHERLDGSGYHRGATGPDLSPPARLLAAADAYHAMIEPRPHRAPLAPDDAAKALTDWAEAGGMDSECVSAVLEAAGHPGVRIGRPAGLTEREVEVVGLLARGWQTKQIAHTLGISVKTADRHVQNSYAKMGVSTRAAAALFAMQNGLMAWGEFPIEGRRRRS